MTFPKFIQGYFQKRNHNGDPESSIYDVQAEAGMRVGPNENRLKLHMNADA